MYRCGNLKVLISTFPFAERDRTPLDLLEKYSINYVINPFGHKLTEEELISLIGDFDAIIAGTEPITDRVMAHASKLKLISRVGIGLDSVDLLSAKNRNIAVSYTPDAPSEAVAELTLGLMLASLRSIHVANNEMHCGEWYRHTGRRLSECVVGIIGVGRIGSKVLHHLSGFNCKKVMLNDLHITIEQESDMDVEWHTKDDILRTADVITLHVPLTRQTKSMITRAELEMMKPDGILINTARGGIIDEVDLYNVLMEDHLGGIAIDTFETEPYKGRLATIDRCLLTAHMGSMSADCRARMEIEATQEAVRLISGETLISMAPLEEYENQR